jgi:hypothetical protein
VAEAFSVKRVQFVVRELAPPLVSGRIHSLSRHSVMVGGQG